MIQFIGKRHPCKLHYQPFKFNYDTFIVNKGISVNDTFPAASMSTASSSVAPKSSGKPLSPNVEVEFAVNDSEFAHRKMLE